MEVRNIIRDWLVKHKCDGLSNSAGECGCLVADLVPCDELNMDCRASRFGDAPEDVDPDHGWWLLPIAEETE